MKVRDIVVVMSMIGVCAPAAYAGFPKDPITKCGPDAVVAGAACVDTYEASVWRVPDPLGANKGLVKKIRKGKATAADLSAGGATQLGVSGDNYTPCNDQGQNCKDDIYAVSLVGVTPSAYMTWFQAQEACTNAGKRLPSNAEWQAVANGTPDPGPDNGTTDCNTASVGAAVATGSRSSCVAATSSSGRLPARSPSTVSTGRPTRTASSAFVVRASHIFVGHLGLCSLPRRGWAAVSLPVRRRNGRRQDVRS